MKNSFCKITATVIMVIATSVAGWAQIPESERQALIALYDATRGPDWTDSNGWLGVAGTECTWFGVTCDDSGAHVIVIYLDSNNLEGELPAQLSQLTELQELKLSWARPYEEHSPNRLSGTIPPELGSLSNLQIIALTGSTLTGSIPPQLGDLSALTRLLLGWNQLSGEIPSELGQLGNLQRLILRGNQLSGEIPAELGNLGSLDRLGLDSNQLSGSIPPDLGNLSSLLRLHLHDNQLSGSIPPELANIPSLEQISLSWNPLGSPIPPELGTLETLRQLWLHNCQLTGSIPREFGSLESLEYLHLGLNYLTGSIPPGLGDLSHLIELSLHGNELVGSIPAEIGNMESLQHLWLNNNRLSGSIPTAFGDLAELRMLFLSDNELTGPIPAGLGELTHVHNLQIERNFLSGVVPAALGNLSNLNELFLNGNQLTGELPGSLSNLTGLLDSVGLDLRYNGLSSADTVLADFIDSKQFDGDWRSTQTVAPIEVGALASGPNSIIVEWSPITYSWNEGRYDLLMGSSSGGPYELLASTVDKTVSRLIVSGLEAANTFHFVVEAVTSSHDQNPGVVTSETSMEVSVTLPGASDCNVTCEAAAPATTAVGAPVLFTSMVEVSNCPSDAEIAWAFGDGGTSSQQNPVHPYGSTGTFSWRMTASADVASCSKGGSITVFEADTECGNGVCERRETAWTCPADCGLGPQESGRAGGSSNRLALPAAVGGIEGVGGTYWVTEAMIHNPGTAESRSFLNFTADDTPSEVVSVGPVILQGGEAAFYDNLVEELFGVKDSGSLRVFSTQPIMLVSRTFNDKPDGSYGQFLGAVKFSHALGVGDAAFLIGLREDDEFRSNVILQEVGGLATKVLLSVMREDGTMVGQTEVEVPAYTKSQNRLRNLDGSFANLESAWMLLDVVSGGQIVAIASVVDQITGDAMTVDAVHRDQVEFATGRKHGTALEEGRPCKQAETVDFTWQPPRPIVAETVLFTELSPADAISWLWSFGDGGNSTEQQPTHSYAAPGTYNVSLSVSTYLGSVIVEHNLNVEAAIADGAHVMVAVAAASPGANQTQWRSDLWVMNPFDEAQWVWLEYRPVDGSGPHRYPAVIRPGNLSTLGDVVNGIFPDAGVGKGGLHLYASQGVCATSRTFNLGEDGTFGQAVPALGRDDLLAVGDSGRLLKMKSTSTTRCNLGFTEIDGVDSRIRVELIEVGAEGMSSLATKTYSVAGFEHLQINRVFDDMGVSGEHQAALAIVEVLSGGRIYAYASNIDNRTGDGELIPAMRR